MSTTGPGNVISTCQYYCYNPTLGAAALVAGFAVATLLHGYQTTRSRSICTIPLIIGGTLEAVGWIARLAGHFEGTAFTLIPFAIQSVTLLIAPTLFAATIYMTHERIIETTAGHSRSPWKLKTFKIVFLIADCVSFGIQLVGSALRLTSSVDNIRLGNRLVMTGMGEQLIFTLIFLFVAGKFHYNMVQHPTDRVLGKTNPQALDAPIPYRKHLITLYIASALVAIRCLVRLLETLYPTSIVHTSEAFMLIFDGGFMVMTIKLFHIVHPSEIDAFRAFYAGGDAEHGFQRSLRYFAGPKVWEAKRLVATDVPLSQSGGVIEVEMKGSPSRQVTRDEGRVTYYNME